MESQYSRIDVRMDYSPCVNNSMMNSGQDVCQRGMNDNCDDHDRQQVEVSVSGEMIAGNRPLPQHRQDAGGNGTVTENEGTAHAQTTDSISQLSHYDLLMDTAAGGQLTRQMIWERKLLDFSLRNNLLNTRTGKRVVPFVSFDIDQLEDHLQEGQDYRILPCPDKKMEPLDSDSMFDSARQAAIHRDYVSELIGQGQLVSYLTETELQNTLKYLYRTARTSIEENGANSLFLALGVLRWYETEKSVQPRYAPILLLPVDMVRRSGNNYVIRKRDEGIVLNITLVELLRQNFRISLDRLQELPKDSHGVDVKLIFNYIRRAIMEQKRWSVQEETLLGLFSFSKFVMWNDIHSNADRLKENPVVAALLNLDTVAAQGLPATQIDARTTDKENAPGDFAIPMDVDSSQMEAVVESGRGGSFILHGPPGTGKSQTITNMIANALYQGKRVLFVAEKMAALSVVQSRLQRIGLEPFCLELHSNKVTKRHFLDQMEKALQVAHINSPKEFVRLSDRLFAERKELIAYMDALHRKGEQGLSLYDSISEYLAIKGDEISDHLPANDYISADYIARCRGYVPEVEAIMQLTGPLAQHPLFGLEPCESSLDTQDALRLLFERFIGQTEQLTPRSSRLLEQMAADASLMGTVRNYVAEGRRCEQMFTELASQHSREVVSLDTRQLRREHDEIAGKWLLPRLLAKRKFMGSMRCYGVGSEADVLPLLDRVEAYQLLRQQLSSRSEAMSTYFDSLCIPGLEQWDTMNETVEPAAQTLNVMADINRLLNRPVTLEQLRLKARTWHDNLRLLRDWQHWTQKKRELLDDGMQAVVEQVEQGTMSPRDAVEAYVKGMYHLLADRLIDGNEQLRMFNGLLFQQKIEKYRSDTRLFQELTKKELYCRLAARIPVATAAQAEGSEISILKRNIANGGRGSSIRSIIDSIPTLLPRLCPCMLMSPISVAQFIDLKAEKFDLVIFDEASQMPTSEAVGAIARGKALAVVGDSKQMPPTSFFTSQQTDEEEADVDDMESILEDCKTLSMQEYFLSWHYRSRHESLIAFSNSQYYEGRLFTFPSADDKLRKVSFVSVDGQYDKGHTRSNPQEAKAVVDEVVRRLVECGKGPEPHHVSIGVVSFSKVQQNLIEDLLTDELDKHSELKEIAMGGPEPVFVKNLENVQGDERDVILFSVGYGPDKNGRLSMNFGPLNNSGGERRLNVAVSRAREEMIVFSTMTADMIDLRRSNARGVEGLKAFLEYAQTGRLPILQATRPEVEGSVMIDQICRELTARGYVATSHVGRSNFKVDIAVSLPDRPDTYILGIMCDGHSYYETKTTRDREIVQPSILQRLEWQTMRVYSIDWYESQQKVIGQIVDRLKHIVEDPGVRPSLQQEKPPAYQFSAEALKEETVSPMEHNANQRPYVEALVEVPADSQAAVMDKRTLIRKILEVEQPVNENYLAKRLARLLGLGHAGSAIVKSIEAAAPLFYRDPLSFAGVGTLWLNKQSAKNYTTYRAPSARAIAEIPIVEIVNVIREIVSEEFSLPEERIPTIAARKLGFGSAGSKITGTIMAVMDYMKQQGIIEATKYGTIVFR